MVLYVGDGKPNMETDLRVGRITYDNELRDIKEIECEDLLNSNMEGRKMPLTITEEIIKQDPFFELGLEKEGEKRAKKLLIKKLLKKGMDLKDISKLLDMPIKEIENLLKDK